MHENARINYGAVVQAGSVHYQRMEAISQLDKCLEEYGTVDLYQAYLDKHRGGQYVIEELDARTKPDGYGETGQYKFKVLKVEDEDGRVRDPQDGDTYWLHVGQKETFTDPKTGMRKPMNTRQVRTMQRRNRERGDAFDLNIWRKLKLDENGCVTVGFLDACNILVNHTDLSTYKTDGFHFEPYYEAEQEDKPKRGRPRKVDPAEAAIN